MSMDIASPDVTDQNASGDRLLLFFLLFFALRPGQQFFSHFLTTSWDKPVLYPKWNYKDNENSLLFLGI